MSQDENPLPDPPIGREVDLRELYAYMPLRVSQLITSDTWILATGDEAKACITLWCQAWHQVPAGSIPNNDKILAVLSGAGSNWLTVKRIALRGFVEHSDGRLYHARIVEKAVEAWNRRKERSDSGTRGSDIRWGKRKKGTRSQRLSKARDKGTHTHHEWLAMLDVFDGLCVKCGSAAGVKDHVLGISVGGSDGIDNIQPMCRRCSSGKGKEQIDYRDQRVGDWEKRLANALKTPSECLADAWVTPSIEEKRRESKKKTSPNGEAKERRRYRLPAEFQRPVEWLTDAIAARARHNLPAVDMELVWELFFNWTQSGSVHAVKTDWHKTWINWALKAEPPRFGNRQPASDDDVMQGI